MICAMPIMSATHAHICIKALKNIRDLPSGNKSKINMGGGSNRGESREEGENVR